MMPQGSTPTGELETEVLQEEAVLGTVPVAVEGTVAVQQVPSRAAGGQQITVDVGAAAIRLIGADPRRRVARIISDASFQFDTNQASVDQGVAPAWPALVPLTLTHGEEVWIKATPATTPPAGVGTPASIIVPNPAAGANWTYTVPAGEVWLLQAWRGQLTTDANVATRSINWRVERPATLEDLMLFTASVGQAAVSTVVYQGTKGIGELPAVRNGGLQMMFPDGLYVEGGVVISVVTQNIQAGDQWSAIHLDIVRYATSAVAGQATISYDVENWAD